MAETLLLYPAAAEAGQRIDAYLSGAVPGLTRSAAQRLLFEGVLQKQMRFKLDFLM